MELKNDVALTGTLHSVDQYLNVKLTDVHVVDAERYPQLVSRQVVLVLAVGCRRAGDEDTIYGTIFFSSHAVNVGMRLSFSFLKS